MIRFADDYVALFATRNDASRFSRALPKRLGKFGLSLAEEKTRQLPFGYGQWRAGNGAEHFDFLGFRHFLGADRKGRMNVIRIPSPKSVHKFLAGIKEWTRDHRHDNPWTQQQQLARKLQGFYQYFALWNTTRKLSVVRQETEKYWLWALKSRSQRSTQAWIEWKRHPWFRLPDPKVLHHTV